MRVRPAGESREKDRKRASSDRVRGGDGKKRKIHQHDPPAVSNLERTSRLVASIMFL